jgi:magnesium transporter
MTTEQASPTLRYFAARGGEVHAVSPQEAIRLVRGPGQADQVDTQAEFVWIDIVNPGEEEAELLRDNLKLHPLAVEDTLRRRQRPKIDRYPDHFFVVFYAASINPDRARLALQEVHIFVGAHFLVTVHDRELPQVAEVMRAWKARPDRLAGPGAVAHALLDAIVDDCLPVVEHFAERVDQLEERILAGKRRSELAPVIELRHQLIMMRRILSPERELVSSLLRHDLPLLSPDLIPYFQDVYDHLLRITEEIDTFRDLLTGLIEVHSSNAANRLNQTMQTLTAWSIILMTITVVAGVYGMNFRVMPELDLPWGYYGALSLMFALGLSLLIYFRRKGWV